MFLTTVSAENGTTYEMFYNVEKEKNKYEHECKNIYTKVAGEASQSSEFIYRVSICQKENRLEWLNRSIQYSPVDERAIEELYSFYSGFKFTPPNQYGVTYDAEYDKSQIDGKKLRDVLIRAYENNSSWAALTLGRLYLSGDYFEKNIEKGVVCLKKFESQKKDGNKIILQTLDRFWKVNNSDRDLGKCSELDKKIIINNWVDSYTLGNLYYSGDVCILKDYKKSHYYLYKFVNNILKEEKNIRKSIIEARYQANRVVLKHELEILLSDTHSKFHKSNYLIGNLYINGYGVLKDRDKAIEFYTTGAKQHSQYDTDIDYVPSEIALAKIYSASSIKKDRALSLFWYKAAANHGSIESQLKLGKFFIEKNDFKQAKQWLQKANLEGSEAAKKLWVENDLSVK